MNERFKRSEVCNFRSLAEEHQENLPYYLEADGYDAVLKILDKVLDFFEDELGQTTWIIYHNVDLIPESRFSN